MYEQDKMLAEKKDQDNSGECRHYGPEADVVHQPAERNSFGKRKKKIADLINHWIFLTTWSGALNLPSGRGSVLQSDFT